MTSHFVVAVGYTSNEATYYLRWKFCNKKYNILPLIWIRFKDWSFTNIDLFTDIWEIHLTTCQSLFLFVGDVFWRGHQEWVF